MLGALVGDAAGATLEFVGRPIDDEMARTAMRMPGRGRLRVGPGQITDDGELTLALWSALRDGRPADITKDIVDAYVEWFNSCPFDIGYTCCNAFETFSEMPLDDAIRAISELNATSEANGALMRASAIPAWAVMLPGGDERAVHAASVAKLDATLSHPSEVCQLCNSIYVYAVTHLMMGKSPAEVLAHTDEFVKGLAASAAASKVSAWYFEESRDIGHLDSTKLIGHVRYGFVFAFYFLRNPDISFEDAIRMTLMKGGDTDTNAAIVGGMVGSYQTIPEYMLEPVMKFDVAASGFGHERPLRFCARSLRG